MPYIDRVKKNIQITQLITQCLERRNRARSRIHDPTLLVVEMANNTMAKGIGVSVRHRDTLRRTIFSIHAARKISRVEAVILSPKLLCEQTRRLFVRLVAVETNLRLLR